MNIAAAPRVALHAWSVFVLPPVGCAVLVALEVLAFADGSMAESLNQRFETTKLSIELTASLVELFVTLATAVLGAVAYYLRSRHAELPRTSWLSAALSSAAAILSIFFGQVTIATLRGQLADDFYEPRATALLWSERGQYVSFLLCLGWFILLVLEREMNRRLGENDR